MRSIRCLQRLSKPDQLVLWVCLLGLWHLQDVGALLRKGVGEAVRDAARLHEQLMQLRVERGRLQREEVLMREKVAYVERVNAELHELLEKCVRACADFCGHACARFCSEGARVEAELQELCWSSCTHACDKRTGGKTHVHV